MNRRSAPGHSPLGVLKLINRLIKTPGTFEKNGYFISMVLIYL